MNRVKQPFSIWQEKWKEFHLRRPKVSELGNKFQFFYESRCFAAVFTGSLQLTWPHGSNPRSHVSIKISFNILLPYTPRFPKWGLFLPGFTTKISQVLNFFVFTTRAALCPSPSLSLIWLTVTIFCENYKLYSCIFLCNWLKPLFNSFLRDTSFRLDTSLSAVLKVHRRLDRERIRGFPSTLQNNRYNRTL